MRKVMVFGTFDGLHQGHRAMLQEAKALGDYLIAVVAQDHIVEHFKGHLPKKNFAERFEHLEKVDHVDQVAIGDAELSIWNVVRRHKPDIIAIGHDQDLLKKDLENSMAELGYKPKIEVLTYYEANKE
ncbi:MAG TPA: adenylyltransferase/cytidyltransferase family protein [Candidatus Paceibacterota bacterium]